MERGSDAHGLLLVWSPEYAWERGCVGPAQVVVTPGGSLSDKDKKQVLEELNEALRSTAPIQHASNVELVRKYLDKIEAAMR